LAEALRILGYRTTHWPKSWAEIDRNDAATDITIASRYQELDQLYPRSKFILTERSLDSWIKSCLFHYRHEIRYEELLEPDRLFTWEAERCLYGEEGGYHLNPERFREAFGRHRTRVLEYFRERPGDFLAINILEGDGWECLCSFLAKPVPKATFPHLNRRVTG